MEALKKIPTLYLVAGVAVLIAAYYAKRGIFAAAEIAATKLNPASDENFIYKDLVGGIVRNTTGDDSQTLGGLIYDATHPAATFENPYKPYCTNFLGIGCKNLPGPVDEDDSTFWSN